ncbi:MAG TPA: patatin-like phospholipase family protein [Nitrososphaeraceae archaeon]|nr:patatin-like phospholipase family protein [Nitrososphaeraceae archaeon]
MAKNNKNIQRALVLQGGGSLGAYEAGVFNALYYWIKKENEENDDNLFDVVAGTSIGAINAAFLVSHVIKKRKEENKNVRESWEGSAEKLEEFWMSQLASNVNLSRWWPFSWDEKSWTYSWDMLNETNPDIIATGEAARRYYSAKEFIINGASNVFTPTTPRIDSKFLDNFIIPNIWYRYDNSRLNETISRSIKFPIATSIEKKEPRLLAISVDVEEGETVTFDSYVKEKGTDNTRRSEYGDYKPGVNGKKGTYERIIKYDKGIMPEHIMASASVPEHYDYTLVPKKYDYAYTEEEQKSIDLQNNDLKNYSRFWDGGVLSNTPLRELIQSHQDYWTLVENIVADSNSSIPDLEVYIVDVWPSVDDYPVPYDLDGIRDRKNDLTYQDKTPYDEKVANIVSDYYNLTNSLMELARKKGATKTEIDTILDMQSKSSHRTGVRRTYRDLVNKKFDITKVIRIERTVDKDDIANKWCDFSLGTITNLFNQGIKDALKTLAREIKISKDIQAAYNEVDSFINNVKKQKANYTLVQSAENVKTMLPNLKV